MIRINKIIGRHYDLTKQSTDGGGGTVVTAPSVGKTDITYVNGSPTVVLKYVDATRATLLYTTNVMWNSGVPTSVVTLNHTTGLTATTTLTWTNGQLVSIDKVTA